MSWHDVTLHVVALGIDPDCRELQEGLAAIRAGRDQRARRMADSLAKAGIADAYEGAAAYVTNERLIGRTHFARFLVETGHVRDAKAAFQQYLTAGKPGYVNHAVGHAAAGARAGSAPQAGRRSSPTRDATKSIPVRCASCSANFGTRVATPSRCCRRVTRRRRPANMPGMRGYSACSRRPGSDYHGPGESWVDLGDMPELPAGVAPVWKDW